MKLSSFLLALGVVLAASTVSAQGPDLTITYSASNNYAVRGQIGDSDPQHAPSGSLCMVRVDVTPNIELGCETPTPPATFFPGGSVQTVGFSLILNPGDTAQIRGFVKPPAESQYAGVANSSHSINYVAIARQTLAPAPPTLVP